MPKGSVRWFNQQKGYGFIKPQNGGNDVFVHIKEVRRAGLDTLRDGEGVEYELVENWGRMVAGNLKLARNN